MTIERLPHPVYSTLWLLWVIGHFVGVAWREPWFLVGLWLYFAVVEGVAKFSASGGLRDTFSEITTWLSRTLSKHRIEHRGWNAMILAVILIIGWNVGMTGYLFGASPLICAPIGGLVIVWLRDHLFSPDVHG